MLNQNGSQLLSINHFIASSKSQGKVLCNLLWLYFSLSHRFSKFLSAWTDKHLKETTVTFLHSETYLQPFHTYFLCTKGGNSSRLRPCRSGQHCSFRSVSWQMLNVRCVLLEILQRFQNAWTEIRYVSFSTYMYALQNYIVSINTWFIPSAVSRLISEDTRMHHKLWLAPWLTLVILGSTARPV